MLLKSKGDFLKTFLRCALRHLTFNHFLLFLAWFMYKLIDLVDEFKCILKKVIFKQIMVDLVVYSDTKLH